jgi:hypothetical protein
VAGVVEAGKLGRFRLRLPERHPARPFPRPVGGDGGGRPPVGAVKDKLAVGGAAGREPVLA